MEYVCSFTVSLTWHGNGSLIKAANRSPQLSIYDNPNFDDFTTNTIIPTILEPATGEKYPMTEDQKGAIAVQSIWS